MTETRRADWLVVTSLIMLIGLLLSGCGQPKVIRVISPEPMLAPAGEAAPTYRLPETVLVELGNGKQEQRAVIWATNTLPRRLERDFTLAGQVEGGLTVELLLQVTRELPRLSAAELKSADLTEAMAHRLAQDMRVKVASWSPDRQQVAFTLGDERLCLWQAGELSSRVVHAVDARFCASIAWSYNSSYLSLDTGTSPARGCIIFDVVRSSQVCVLLTSDQGHWAPHRNAMLVGLYNQEIELNWRAPEYGIDLAVYDLDTRQLHTLLRSSQEYEFLPLSWDDPKQVAYKQVYFHDDSRSRSLVYAIDQLTGSPALPTPPAGSLATREQLDPLLQRAGLREITWSPDGLAVAFLTAEDLYIWNVLEPAPVLVESLGRLGFPARHHLFWSPDSHFLAVHDGKGNDVQLKVLRAADYELLADLPVYTQAYWALDADQLLLAQASAAEPTLQFTIDYLTDLVLYDVETGASRVLLAADGEHSYRPNGWVKPGEASYELFNGCRLNPWQTINVND